MVELKQLELKNKSVLGIQLLLPNMTMYFIVYQHHILCDESIDVRYLLDRSPTLSIMQVQVARGFADLLSQEIAFVSPRMKRCGIRNWMKGSDALEALP